MKVVILGAGGWGALVGAYLSKAGADVTLLFRRQAHVDEIAKNGGLIIQSAEGDSLVPVTATTQPGEVSEADLLIVAVKNHDTETALQGVQHMKVGAVASVQNGLGHGERFRKFFPQQEVLRIVSRVAGSLLNYGKVQRGDKDFPTWVGNPFNGITPLAQEVAELFNASGLPCEATNDIEGVEWCKVIWWTPSSISAVLARLPQTEVMQSPEFAYLMVMMTRDMVRVARALDVNVQDYPTIEVMDRCDGELSIGIQNVIKHGREWEERGGKGYKQAMLLDVERGRRTEIEDTAGYIWHLAQQNGIGVPYLDFGYQVVRGFDEKLK
ncbi:MAG: 2-dehydropantoate 2-reductase [Anaerolineaceae bacterium]|nr:2-dehydropantoate 2-reductase [Anaerolineaceae bacterium]